MNVETRNSKVDRNDNSIFDIDDDGAVVRCAMVQWLERPHCSR